MHGAFCEGDCQGSGARDSIQNSAPKSASDNVFSVIDMKEGNRSRQSGMEE